MVAEAFLFAVESTEYTSKWQNVQCMFMKRWFLYRKHSGVSKHSAIVSNGRPFRRHNMVAFVFVPAVVAQWPAAHSSRCGARKGRLKLRIIFDLAPGNAMLNSAPAYEEQTKAWIWPQDWSIQWMKKMLLGAFSCRTQIKSLEHLLRGRCSLQLLVGTFGRGRVVAASTFAHAVFAPSHGWSWRLFLGIGSKRWWNWNARLRFQVSRYLEQ